MRPPFSLTKAQAETPAGLELVAILEEIADDGVITNGELGRLRGWLDENQGAGFEGAELLFARIEEIIADGLIEHDERTDLLTLVRQVLVVPERL